MFIKFDEDLNYENHLFNLNEYLNNRKKNNIIQDNVISDNVIQDNIISDNVIPDNVIPDNVISDNVIPDNVISDNVIPDNVIQDNVIPDNVIPDNVIPDNVIPDNVISDNVIQNNVIPDNVILNKIITDSLKINLEYLNNYIFNINKNIKINKLYLNKISLPKQNNNNIENNNKLVIEIQNNKYTIEIPSKYYNRYELIEYLNNNLPNEIKCYIENSRFTFKSEEIFKILNDDNSVINNLGFIKNSYHRKNIYVAEMPINIGDNIFYLVIDNLLENKPLFLINNDENKIEKLNEIENTDYVDELIIKFNITEIDNIKNNIEYSFFFENHHFIEFNYL